jgi:glutamate dehydrogenase
VRAAVEDWPAMRERMQDAAKDLARVPKGVDKAEAAEVREFLAWVLDNHFTFLGYRDYQLSSVGGEDLLRIVAGTGLGVLREPRLGGVSASFSELPPRLRALAREPRPLVLTKANARATVHRPGYLDYIGLKRFDAAGRVAGERRFVGLYTTSAYQADASLVPLLRTKVARVIERAGFPPGSHGHKNLVSVLQDYPRDELFQVEEETLLANALGVLRLGDRRRTRVFLRRDVYGRFWSCLVYLPRDNYNTDVRLKIQSVLLAHLKGASAEYNLQLTDAVLARIHVLVRTHPRDEVEADPRAIEAEIARATRRWEDDLRERLAAAGGEDRAIAAFRAYAFPAAYRDTVDAPLAERDIAVLDRLAAGEPHAVTLYRPVESDARSLRLRVYRAGARVPLSGSLPILENMGLEALEEQSWEIGRAGSTPVFIHDFGVRGQRDIPDVEAVKAVAEETLLRVARGEIENDAFNRLTLAAALAPDDVVVLRAYARYLKQAGFPFSHAYLAQTLAAHPELVGRLVALFRARFDPAFAGDRAAEEKKLVEEARQLLNNVSNLDEDRILRRFLALVRATLRTNHWVRDAAGARKAFLSLKIESARVPDLPEPRPMFEVFVYSPRFEAIHLRGGKVARGGLRWSDRPEDFRTEILGLMKAQMVKNAVIVPVGSKGGFVLKAAPPASDREAFLAEGVACYRNFLRGLLDLTDNLVAGQVVPPKDVVRHDPDDPYLVVAADKGTAAFSDYANGVSAEYGFWLGDAFASGGSAGYDHKKMGITARGAWESVKRHFREMGVDTQSQDFTVVGVGDMSGDVFGNGMLLSPHIRLLAAFDHRHIFLDPDPDRRTSFAERERLFALPRSSWADYDRSISKGGGVFPRTRRPSRSPRRCRPRSASPIAHLTPAELMKAILKAPVDLLYNGGIGTYVKAASSPTPTPVTVPTTRCASTARACAARWWGRAATSASRSSAASSTRRPAGAMYTDAIDNSGGVDCSDHEVNIKILLGLAEQDGELTRKQRDKLLAEMTEEVGRLVLVDNYQQTQSLAVSGVRGEKLLDAQAAFMRALEKAGRLNRAVEFLPADDEVAERRAARRGLTAPERAVLAIAASPTTAGDRGGGQTVQSRSDDLDGRTAEPAANGRTGSLSVGLPGIDGGGGAGRAGTLGGELGRAVLRVGPDWCGGARTDSTRPRSNMATVLPAIACKQGNRAMWSLDWVGRGAGATGTHR